MKNKVGDIGYQIEFEDLDFKRYIRVNDNIFDLQSYRYFIVEKCEDILRKPISLNVENRFSINTRSIINQADTIEELCDEFVVIYKEMNGKHTVHKYNWLGKSEQKLGNEVYGAIWTDKGLIYVAKMNEKGELELL